MVEFEWGKLVRMCDDGGVERSKEESRGVDEGTTSYKIQFLLFDPFE